MAKIVVAEWLASKNSICQNLEVDIEAETDKAILVELSNGRHWLPKSQITILEQEEKVENETIENKIRAVIEGKDTFLIFDYRPDIVEQVKRLPVRKWDSKNKYWVIPTKNIDLLEQLVKVDIIIEEEKQDVISYKELKEVKTVPMKHQVQAIEYGLSNKAFLLADQQGLGKTLSSLYLALSQKKDINKCLIITGVKGLQWNWYNEIKKHTNEQPHILGSYETKQGRLKIGSVAKRTTDLQKINEMDNFFFITNIATIRDKTFIKELKKLTESNVLNMCIIDEIHKAKSHNSQQGKAIHNIKTKHKVALTGTPLMNSPLDLYNILKWLEIDYKNFWVFQNRYTIKGHFNEVVGYKNLDELQYQLNLVQLRRTKKEVIDLPEKIRTAEYVIMPRKQELLYYQVLSGLKDEYLKKKIDTSNALAQIIRLRQVTSNPEILRDGIPSAKKERLLELLEEANENNEKVVIFSNWTKVINPLFKELSKYNPALVTGEVSDKQKEVGKFQNDESCKVILGTVGALGTGFTLTEASIMIFVDKPWTFADTEQAEDRIHRIGTKKSVNIITLICKDTIDEMIEEVIQTKKDWGDKLVNQEFGSISVQKIIKQLMEES